MADNNKATAERPATRPTWNEGRDFDSGHQVVLALVEEVCRRTIGNKSPNAALQDAMDALPELANAAPASRAQLQRQAKRLWSMVDDASMTWWDLFDDYLLVAVKATPLVLAMLRDDPLADFEAIVRQVAARVKENWPVDEAGQEEGTSNA